MKKLAVFVLASLMTMPALFAQFSGVPNESMGSHLKTPEEKALNEYARGVKDRQRGDEEQNHDKKMKLYTRAKDEFSKSVGYYPHFDGYLALGQVYLLLGLKESALDACSHAVGMKPNSEPAQQCVKDAQKKPETGEAKPAGGQ